MKELAIIVKEASYTVGTDGVAFIDSKGTTRDVHLFGGEAAVCIHIPKGMPLPKLLVTGTEDEEMWRWHAERAEAEVLRLATQIEKQDS